MSFAILAAAALIQAQPAAPAQPVPPPPGETIVVTGERALPSTPAEARQQVNSMITTREGQISRFFAPVCPTVIGMNPNYTRVVALRMREVAQSVGVAVAPPGCRANVALIVVSNPRAFIRALLNARPALFVGVEPNDMTQILQHRQPAVSWTSSEIINEDGFAMNADGVLQVRSASIISEPTRQSSLSSIVVIDEAAADGKSLGQLADYTVMRAIAGAEPPAARGGSQPSTILALFDRQDAPAEVTRFDRAYLRALYRSRANQRSQGQMAQMSRMIAREAAREAADEVREEATRTP